MDFSRMKFALFSSISHRAAAYCPRSHATSRGVLPF